MPSGEAMRIILKRTAVLVAVLCITSSAALAVDCKSNTASENGPGETWLINTRSVPLCNGLENGLSRIQCWKLAGGRWELADFDTFDKQSDPSMPTIVFVHGNRTTNSAAIKDGSQLRNRLRRLANDRPFRLVVWSWPSNRELRKIRKDVQTKARRSDVEGYYLATWLRRIRKNNADTPISLVGYSLGARAITGALHMLAGGQVAGRSLPAEAEGDTDAEAAGVSNTETKKEARPLFQVVLVAAALDDNWLLPGRRNGLALSQVDKMLVTRNRADSILKWYPLIHGPRGNEALGYVGPRSCGRLYSCNGMIDILDVHCSVGKEHSWACYIADWKLNSQLALYTFPEVHKEPSE
jgi:pimeloyl-ACP methyl ester carboxylesterase